MTEKSHRNVAIISRIAFAPVAALAGWMVAWGIEVAWYAALPVINHMPPQYPTTWDIAPVLALYTFAAVIAVTLVFGMPYVAIRSTPGMLRRPWRFYLDTGLAGTATMIGYYFFIFRVHWPKEIISGFLFAIGTSVAATMVTSFVFLRWLRWQSRSRVPG